MANILLYHRIFKPDPWGHGGEKRAAQLQEIYDQNALQVDEFKLGKAKIGLLAIFRALKSVLLSQGRKAFFSKKSLYYLKAVAWNITPLYAYLKKSSSVLLWESTGDFFYFIPYLAIKKGKKIIALPHNLESLIPESVSLVTNKKTPNGFLKEIEVLKKCDAVFTISREEQWLLSLFGVKAFYLPYYPPRVVQQQLLQIRERRKDRKRTNSVLMLGSALNRPTQVGMQQMMDAWGAMKNAPQLRVAGYYTSQRLKISSDNVIMLGELTNEQLEEEMYKADCLLINQPPTTGALTRIVEFLIAGVPVVVNEPSARSYWGTDGIYVYRNNDDFERLLWSDFDTPQIPSEPDVTELLNKIYALK